LKRALGGLRNPALESTALISPSKPIRRCRSSREHSSVRAFDDGAGGVRTALESLPDEARSDPWKLSFQGKTLFEGTRFLVYRHLFLNHLVHHRAQLGVQLPAR
jgi:hypothetical protein